MEPIWLHHWYFKHADATSRTKRAPHLITMVVVFLLNSTKTKFTQNSIIIHVSDDGQKLVHCFSALFLSHWPYIFRMSQKWHRRRSHHQRCQRLCKGPISFICSVMVLSLKLMSLNIKFWAQEKVVLSNFFITHFCQWRVFGTLFLLFLISGAKICLYFLSFLHNTQTVDLTCPMSRVEHVCLLKSAQIFAKETKIEKKGLLRVKSIIYVGDILVTQ